tara:strand:- start:90 stop:464 length:375 start_codon:yes stop_codon:yes gene_type:complete
MNADIISVPISLGELWDKYSILIIKKLKISNPEKLNYINKELELLEKLCKKNQIDKSFYNNLLEINTKLWNIEDKIREKEKKSLFDKEFISIARSVYKYNDKRASIKYEINTMYNSLLCEIKDY